MSIEVGLNALRGIVSVFSNRGVTPSVVDTEFEEVVDPCQTLSNLKLKSDIMRDMIDTGQVEQFPVGRVRWLVRSWFSTLVSDGGIEGLDNLRDAISRARTTGKRLIFTPAHTADADHLTAIYLMGNKRRALGIENEIVWIGGVNMQKRPDIKRFMRSEHVIYNVTPRDMKHLRTLLDEKDGFGFDQEQIETLEQIRRTFFEMNAKARERIIETCVRGKKPLVIYIEGGRSYDGYLRTPSTEFAWFFPRNGSAEVVPFRVYGSKELNPPGKNPGRIFRKEMLLFWRRQEVSMKIGTPYSSSEVWEVWRERMQEANNGDSEKVTVNPVEWPAANIANIDPAHVKSEHLSLYRRLMRRFASLRDRMNIQELSA